MITFGLKLWSSNYDLFAAAVEAYQSQQIDFIELYHDARKPVNYAMLAVLRSVPVTVHHTNDGNWHEFKIGAADLSMWANTVKLTDWFHSPFIIVHPGRQHTVDSFSAELKKIDDPRILIENMAGRDIQNRQMFAQTLDELQAVCRLRPICFDLEKAVKAAVYQQQPYQKYITDALLKLLPRYFHISGGDTVSPIDQHINLWEATFDVGWMRQTLESYSQNQIIRLVFETPKLPGTLENDFRNMDFFKTV